MRTDRRSPDAIPTDAEAEADIAELDQLIASSQGSVVGEAKAMAAKITARASDARSLGAMRDAITDGLHELDLSSGTALTTGVIVAAAAMGVAHGRGERVSGWPSSDGLVARQYWQSVAGWTDEEYAAVVIRARAIAIQAHSTIMLEHAHRASDHVDSAVHDLARDSAIGAWSSVQHTLAEIEHMGEIVTTMKEDEDHMVKHRGSLVADAETSAEYAMQKYTTQLDLALEDDLLVYVTKDDGKVRPNHLALHMKAWPAKSPVWRRIYPPNGLHCRCTAVKRSMAWAAQNLPAESLRTTVPRGGGPDKGFSRDPRARRKTDVSKYRPAHVSALAGARRV